MFINEITNFLLKRAARAAEQPPFFDPKEDNYVMPYCGFYKWVVGICAIGFILVGALGLTLETSTPQGPFILITICGVFVFLSFVAINEVFMVEVRFSAHAITARNQLTGQSCQIAWDQISRVHYSVYSHWFCFTALTGKKIRVSRYRAGFKEFCSNAWKYLPPEMAREFNALVITHLDSKP